MKKIILFLLTTLMLVAWDKAVVTRVVDGDTVKMKELNSSKAFTARLIGLDTFETKFNHRVFLQFKVINSTKFKKVIKLGNVAKQYTFKKVFNKEVKYLDYGADQYGRHLVWISGLNYLLVANGHATVFEDERLDKIFTKALKDANREAKKQHRGIYNEKKSD